MALDEREVAENNLAAEREEEAPHLTAGEEVEQWVKLSPNA